jgi:DNA-directed RNA polymerase specialized sigma24 family protein
VTIAAQPTRLAGPVEQHAGSRPYSIATARTGDPTCTMAPPMTEHSPPRRPPRRPRQAESHGVDSDALDAELRALRGKLSIVLRRLPDVERRVVELRMGLVDGTPAKPGQVAERLGMSIPEVKRIEARAFQRIREVGPIKGLERFLDRER